MIALPSSTWNDGVRRSYVYAQIHVMDSRTLRTAQTVDLYADGIIDFDVESNLLCACGYTTRFDTSILTREAISINEQEARLFAVVLSRV